jgi:hypothetical protein
MAAHHEKQDWLVAEYAQAVDRNLAEQYREDFGWRLYLLH